MQTQELSNPLYVTNNPDRCYYCKSELFEKLDEMARIRGVGAVAFGINADDTSDFRPGHRATAEHRVLAPLLEAGLTKAEIRQLSRSAGLPTWDRPASACLSSRIPYGTAVTPEVLSRIERAEAALRELAFRQFRVRHYGEHARVEFSGEELGRAFEAATAARIREVLCAAGYAIVEMDPLGYRQGALNEALKPRS